MTSYQYRKSHFGDNTILRPSYLHNGISYGSKMSYLYWIRVQNAFFIWCQWSNIILLLLMIITITIFICRRRHHHRMCRVFYWHYFLTTFCRWYNTHWWHNYGIHGNDRLKYVMACIGDYVKWHCTVLYFGLYAFCSRSISISFNRSAIHVPFSFFPWNIHITQ